MDVIGRFAILHNAEVVRALTVNHDEQGRPVLTVLAEFQTWVDAYDHILYLAACEVLGDDNPDPIVSDANEMVVIEGGQDAVPAEHHDGQGA